MSSLATGFMREAAATATLIGTRILLGLAPAAVFPVAAMAVSQYVAAEHRVRANAFYISAASLGAAVAPLMMAPVMERFGWRAVFLLSVAVGAATAAIWMSLMPRIPTASASNPALTLAALRRSTQRLASDPSLQQLSIAYLLHSAVYFVFVFWFFRYLTEGRGFTVLDSGLWGSIPNIAGFVFAPIIGAMADRLGRRIGDGRARRRVAMG
ncbi:MFS transporter [Gemmatimonas sp.]|uniref:MFS transporter n=1 Tax=Gemmatimonas sp. TaxID=1962908 RepID=UPI00286DFB24|nr:MFS transporter [Gemmatimonas sp.]